MKTKDLKNLAIDVFTTVMWPLYRTVVMSEALFLLIENYILTSCSYKSYVLTFKLMINNHFELFCLVINQMMVNGTESLFSHTDMEEKWVEQGVGTLTSCPIKCFIVRSENKLAK